MPTSRLPDIPHHPTEAELAASIAGDGNQETRGTWLATGPYDGEAAETCGQVAPAPDADGDWYESRA